MSRDPYRYFRTEAHELIEHLMQGVLELEKGHGDAQLVPRLLRSAHTLKGAARVVGQMRIAGSSHAMEEILGAVRDDPSPVSAEVIRQLLAAIDGMSAELAALGSRAPAAAPSAEARAPLGAAAEPADEPFEVLRVDVDDMDALLRTVSELRVQLAGLARQTRRLQHTARRAADLAGRPATGEPPGEDLESALQAIHRSVSGIVDRSARELDTLQEQATGLRLLPADSLFPLLERTVRDAAEATRTRVAFDARGGDVRLDAHGLRVLRSALVHLVRNAVTHGVEPPDERAAAGKAATGSVQVTVERRGDRAVFRCRDDGRGVDVERVRRVMLARDLVSPAEAAQLTPAGALALLLRGGITTRTDVSQLAGRGIGLDVVRAAVASLDGTIEGWTEPGRGTRIEVSVPVMVESQEVLHVRAGRALVSIPRRDVRQTLRVSAAEIARSPGTAAGAAQTILCDGRAVRFLPLGQLVEPGSAARPAALSAVVLESGSGTAAVGVDHLVGTERVVIRAMPEILGDTPLVGGAFLDSEGNPQLVLDVEGVIEAVRAGAVAPARDTTSARRLPLLVIDDSLTTRMLEQGILETAGYEVDAAASGEEALQKARRRRYGAFIVDVEMPGMDGFTFIRTARADPQLSAVPSIVLTSRDSADDRARGAEVGASAYIVKSAFDEALLLESIRELAG